MIPTLKHPEELRDQVDSLTLEVKWNGYQYYLTTKSLDQISDLMTRQLASQVLEARTETLEKFVADLVGKRCKTKDVEDFPNLHEYERCAVCSAWELADEYAKTLGVREEKV